MLASGDVFAGYVIERQLGRGGMGSVYLAKHPRLPRMTALKLLNREMFFDKEVRARFEREADLVAQLDHPNIVTVYDRGLEDEQLWISMQFIDGIDAASVQPQALPPQRAVQIIKETADALDYAHGIGVLHRDVKPANILLARSGSGRGERVYLTDFGIARFRDDTGHLTQTGTFTATLAYASPEQLTGAALDHRSDQYSLACSLFWLFTGSGPFAATNPAAVIQGHLQGTAPALSTHRQGLPYALDGVLAKAMAKRPDDRFPTCADFAAAAKQALNAPSAPSMPLAGGPRPYTAPPIPVTGPRPSTAPPIPVTGQPYQHAHAPQTSGPNHLAGQSFPTPPPHTLADRPQGTGPNPQPTAPYQGTGHNPQPTAPYQGPQHQGPQPGYNFAPPPGPPMGIAARPPAGPPRKKSNAGLIIGISVGVVVLILVVLGIIGAVTDDGSTAGTTTTSATKPGTVVDATAESISAEFPRMVPASTTEEVGYNGAKCWETDTSYTPSPGAGDPDFGAWAWQWRCYGGGTNSDPLYRIYIYKSAADAQAVISKLPSNTKAMDSNGGQSYTNYKFDESGPKIVTAFTGDPDRAQYLMFTDGSGTIDEVLRWWRSAPLN
ncbi:serine/threonine-protein kinase [Nocardia brasiliensis]|uniref:non-specific serine/threonine protein kinase n=1 Tax=Nocardia brasiliensis (strain ATCC 700358 / HUJEG-1) TaxID=1133849 RepID=K0FBX4_NOCB7|nr:serine/threonine-protein kinase [Nocardia brasiliensis]AFU05026.1 serine/threonine protein kinase [Nocardia brasiliensis ATCC 700358]OCF84528.1 serine/threonine protein kinase [Nocardia brasiliensis]